MVGVNLLRNNATNMIFENLPLFTSLTITKKCELVCFISIDFEASRGIFSLRTADVLPVVASETGAKKTGCSRRPVVCYTAVISVVTQRSSWGGALRDDTNNTE